MASSLSPAPNLKGLNRRERKEAVIEWFMSNFEDPAESTPYESAEGGYQWIWGGPYDAREEIEGAFDLDEPELEEIVDAIQSDGLYDWAPHTNRIQPEDDDIRDEEPDRDDLRILLTELRGEIQTLRELHVELRERPIGLGHNGPPEDELVPSEVDLDETEAAVAEVESQLDVAQPDSALLIRARTKFTELAAKVRGWLGKLPAWIAQGAVTGTVGMIAGQSTKYLIEHPEKFANLLDAVSGVIGTVFF